VPIQTAPLTDFTKGELNGKFSGRFDLDLYNKGVQKLENWVPFTQGGVRSRAGMRYLGVTGGTGAKARLIPFVVSETNPFVLEFTNNLIRIWKGTARVGAPTEVVSTYTLAQLFQIQYVKIRNVLYLVHTGHPIATLTWNGGTSFTLAALTITFASGVDAWVGATAYAVGDVVVAGTLPRIYECITAGTSHADTAPTAETDDVTDGTAHWYWLATKPFSQASDYPACIAHFQGRMYYAGSINDPQTVWASQPFWYGDMNIVSMISYTSTQIDDASGWANPLVPETSDTTYTRSVYGEGDAFSFEIASDEDDDIYWILGSDALIIGTCSAEWVVPPGVTALNIQVMRRSGFGSAYLQATMFQDAPVFAQGTLSKALLREYSYLAQSAELQSPDLTFAADHMLESGVTQIAVAKMPQPTLFAVTDGELACLLYNKAYGVMAWYHITTPGDDGDIESVCVVPGTTDDEVYVSVSRAGGRSVERFDLLWNTTLIPLDSYVDIASIAGATQSGLDRFDGEVVTIYNFTDLTVHSATVAAGSLTYPTGDGTGDHVAIGLGFTCSGQTMRLNTQVESGSGQGQIKRVGAVIVRVLSSRAFKIGYSETLNLETSQRPDDVAWTANYTGDVLVPMQSDWNRDAWVWFVQDEPFRTTILAMIPEIST
jgi:hypothetical protein